MGPTTGIIKKLSMRPNDLMTIENISKQRTMKGVCPQDPQSIKLFQKESVKNALLLTHSGPMLHESR